MEVEKEIEEIKEKQTQLEKRIGETRKEILEMLAEAFRSLGVGPEEDERSEMVKLERKAEKALSK